MLLEHRGRRKTFKAWSSVFALAILLIILLSGLWMFEYLRLGLAHAEVWEQADTQMIMQQGSVRKDNETLKDKLDNTLENIFIKSDNKDWDTFVEQARALAPVYDYPLNVLLSQAALESAHGKSGFALERHNYFGYRCNDGREQEMCAYFSSPAESMVEYMRLIKYSPRYEKAYAARNNPNKMIEEIRAAGYATDSDYVSKVKSMKEWSIK